MGDVVRADHQSQDREGAQADDPADAATAGRSGHPVACSSNAANSCALLSASPRAPCPRTIAHSMPCGRGWTRGAASGTYSVGMARQGYDLQLTRYDDRGWRATFYMSGMEHSPTSATGSAWERTAWRAVQGAAWDTLSKAEESNR